MSGNAALFEAEVTAQSVKCMLPKHNTVAAASQTTSPKQLLTAQGVRLDGRSFDQFRNTCTERDAQTVFIPNRNHLVTLANPHIFIFSHIHIFAHSHFHTFTSHAHSHFHITRTLDMKTGVINGARGSAYVELNGTKVMCAVYGPKQLTQEFSEVGRLQVDVQLAAFARDQQLQHGYSVGDRSGAAAVATQMQQEQVREALQTVVCLDKIPKSVIEVNLFVLEDDGGATGAAISCSSLALADAGVEMVDLVAACSAVRVNVNVGERVCESGE